MDHRTRRAGSSSGDRAPGRASALPRALARFLEQEAAGGILLVAAVVAALAWASSPWSGGYHSLWHTDLSISLGGRVLREDLHGWVGDGLMALFFLVIGLEIKVELTTGFLRDRRAALVPAAGALGGMAVPALLFAASSAGTEASRGWGIPMATDVAVALGVLALLGRRVPPPLKVLLLALAIIDDVGAIVVIALVYSDAPALGWLAGAAGGLVAIALLLRRRQVGVAVPFILLGGWVWLATFESGVHATIAGVALGLLVPARPDERAGDGSSPAQRLRDRLHPWTSFLVVPVFALANAGLDVTPSQLGPALGTRVVLAVGVGLVVGKLVGIAVGMGLAVRFAGGRLPDGVGRRHLLGLAAVGGVGFTVSIFVADLAYDRAALVESAKLGVLAASTVAAVVGSLLLVSAARSPSAAPCRGRGS